MIKVSRCGRAPRAALFLAVALLLSSVPWTAAADGNANDASPSQQSAWLKTHASSIRSIDPGDEDFSDLAHLRTAIGDARVVMLGEQSHGDGATLAAKVRMIKFLHREMGFDVLAFESGLYDVDRVWREIEAGKDPAAVAGTGIFTVWTDSAQVRPLFSYVAETLKSKRPLELAGFDLQLTGTASREHLVADLEGFLASVDPKLSTAEPASTVLANLRALLADPKAWRATPAEAREQIVAAHTDLARRLRESKRGSTVDPTAAFWAQWLESASTFFRFMWGFDPQKLDPAIMNLRDEQMGKNLVWLAQNRFANRKIVVWGATSHLSRNRALIETGMNDKMVPMGDIVGKAIGSSVYTIGFTSYEGAMGFPRDGERGQPRDIGVAADGTLEHMFAVAGFENAFLDLTRIPEGGEWLREKQTMRPMGYAPMRADWTQVLDGLVFIRRMTPSTKAL